MTNRRSAARGSATKGRQRQAALLHRLIRWGIYFTLITPLLVWDRLVPSEITPKVVVFQVLTELLCGLALIALLFHTNMAAPSAKGPRLTPAVAALAVFLMVSFVSALFGTDFTRSLWGFIERQDGLILLFHFFAWMCILTWTARTHADPRRFILTCLMISFGVSVAASLSILYESYKAAAAANGFVLWRIFESPLRAGGVFGNPVYSGPYLLFHLFWGLLAIHNAIANLRKKLPPGRIVWAVSLVLLLAAECLIAFAVLSGQTRGVVLGLAAGFLVMMLGALARSTPRPIRLASAAALLLIILGAGIVWRYRNTGLVNHIPLLTRVTRLSPSESASTRTRLFAWRSALEGFLDKPVLGWGPRNVYYALNKHYDPRQVQFSLGFYAASETWHDKAHNWYLDLLAEGGVLGMTAFVVLVVVVSRSLQKMSDRPLALCLSAGLAGYAVSNFVAFDGFGSLLGLFLTLAAVAVHEQPVNLSDWRATKARGRTKSKRIRTGITPGRQLAGFAAAAIILLGLYSNVSIARASNGYAVAGNTFPQDPGAAITHYEQAFERFSPYHAHEKLKCAYLAVNAAITKRPSSRSFDAGGLVLKFTGEALRSHPEDARFYLLLNEMYNGLAMYGDRRLADDAERFGKKALELSPGRQEVMFNLGRTYIIKGEAARAVEINRRMVTEYPDFALGHWFLGLSYLANSQRDQASQEVRIALQKGYRFQTQEEINTVKPLFDEKEFAQLTAQ